MRRSRFASAASASRYRSSGPVTAGGGRSVGGLRGSAVGDAAEAGGGADIEAVEGAGLAGVFVAGVSVDGVVVDGVLIDGVFINEREIRLNV